MCQACTDLVSLDEIWKNYCANDSIVQAENSMLKCNYRPFFLAEEVNLIGWILHISLKFEPRGVFVYKHGKIIQYGLQGPFELYSAIEVEGMPSFFA